MSKDEQLMERALERLASLRDNHPDWTVASANGLTYIIDDLKKRLEK